MTELSEPRPYQVTRTDPTVLVPLTQLQLLALLELLDNSLQMETPGFDEAIDDAMDAFEQGYETLTGVSF